jgi:uroporphyrinogen decarboxylase
MRNLLKILDGENLVPPPLWMMRQAGRYLPEYRAVRQKAGSFLDLCFNAERAAEVTLQPIRRFVFDAAIIFSDILVVPHALGQKVWFEEGEGPRLEAISNSGELTRLASGIDLGRLEAVFSALKIVREALPATTTLLGFCGAPWTVAGYMLAGRGGASHEQVRTIVYREPGFCQALIDLLVESSVTYLTAQLDAGADAVQIFESFAGALPPALFETWSLKPIRRIVDGVRKARPAARVIVFARNAGIGQRRVAAATGANCIGLDWSVPLDEARELQKLSPVQGNLDPLCLVAGGAALRQSVSDILGALHGGSFIFNLGHGILPQTPIAHVEAMIEQVRAFRPGRDHV